MTNDGPLGRLNHFTPLRYPGGKGKLAAYVKRIMKANRLTDGEYVEPYAGGAAIALELLFHEYVTRIHINDVSRPVWSFWQSVLHHTDELSALIRDTPRTVEAWDKQKAIFKNEPQHTDLEVGFATFFLNRTNRSGILNAGIIGGRDQTGPWKIDARYNADELIHRIQSIAKMRNRINLTCLDAVRFINSGIKRWPTKTLIYLDPPYYVKGRDLYYDFYLPNDHQRVADVVRTQIKDQSWIVSYDNVPEIQAIYEGERFITYSIGYSARSAGKGTEIMFFGDGLDIPETVGAIQPIDTHYMAA
ncbi:DNA adenine methylase [Mesorhizobium sp. M0292]|uniref:DNA adenine methylase n=1 Tax=Mesorhizobium sp. M0292 TaxID=2956929 RepID=UPI00333AFB06